MKRYILNNNLIIDTKLNREIGQYFRAQFKDISEMVERANLGEQEIIDTQEWIKEEKRIADKGRHVGGMSDW